MASNEAEQYIASLIASNIGVRPNSLLDLSPNTPVKFQPGQIFSSSHRLWGHTAQVKLRPLTINATRTMILQDPASFPESIGIIYQPPAFPRAIVSAVSRDYFTFLLAYRTYYRVPRNHLYAYLNPDVLK